MRTLDDRMVFKILREAGIKRGSRSWADYERAKRILQGMATSPGDYDNLIGAITRYLQV